MYKFLKILIILVIGIFLNSTEVMAKTVGDCNENNVCAFITVPDCVTPDTDFEIHVEGDYEYGDFFSVHAYGLYENAEVDDSGDVIEILSGTKIDNKGFGWGNRFEMTYTCDDVAYPELCNKPVGEYTYTFAFGSRDFVHAFEDFHVAATVGIDFAGESTEVAFDVKPKSCPNPLNVNKNGILSVAIAGSADFDVTWIDPATIQLTGVPGVPLIRYSYEDVATLYEPYSGKVSETDCTDAGADGMLDLVLKFKAKDVVAALQTSLDCELVDGEACVVSVSAELIGSGICESTIYGEDVIRIINKQ